MRLLCLLGLSRSSQLPSLDPERGATGLARIFGPVWSAMSDQPSLLVFPIRALKLVANEPLSTKVTKCHQGPPGTTRSHQLAPRATRPATQSTLLFLAWSSLVLCFSTAPACLVQLGLFRQVIITRSLHKNGGLWRIIIAQRHSLPIHNSCSDCKLGDLSIAPMPLPHVQCGNPHGRDMPYRCLCTLFNKVKPVSQTLALFGFLISLDMSSVCS